MLADLYHCRLLAHPLLQAYLKLFPLRYFGVQHLIRAAKLARSLLNLSFQFLVTSPHNGVLFEKLFFGSLMVQRKSQLGCHARDDPDKTVVFLGGLA